MHLSLATAVFGLLCGAIDGYRLPRIPALNRHGFHGHISAPIPAIRESTRLLQTSVSSPGVIHTNDARSQAESVEVTGIKMLFQTENTAELSRHVTKLLPRLSGGDLQLFWDGFVLKSDAHASKLDLQAHTAAMSALNRHQRHEVAIRTYEHLLHQHAVLDAVAYTCAARAAGFCRPFAYTLQLLEDAHSVLGTGCVSVAATAIINKKYMPRSASTANDIVRVLDWLGEKSCAPSTNVMDSALAVAVAHGTDADCAEILSRMRAAGVLPTIYSYNALLDRAARRGDEAQALSVVAQMQVGGIVADSTTYNTLLKLYVNRNDADGAVKVVNQMRSQLGMALSDVTESLLLRLQRNAPDSKTAAEIAALMAHQQTPTAHSRFVFANRIEACGDDVDAARALFAEAERVKQADAAVYIAVAKCLARSGNYRAAFVHIDLMLRRGVDINAYALSFAQRITREVQELPGDQRKLRAHAFDRLIAYMRWCKENNPRLLTSAVWLNVLELSLLESWECQAALGNLAAEVLTDVYGSAREFSRSFVDLYTSHVNAQLRVAKQQPKDVNGTDSTASHGESDFLLDEYAASYAQFFTSLCRALQRDGTGDRPLAAYLNTHRFDAVIGMLTTAGRHDLVSELHWLRRLDYPAEGAAQSSSGSTLEATEKVPGTAPYDPQRAIRLRPTAYAVMSAVQSARRRGDVDMAVDALTWGLQHRLLAFHVVQEAVSFLYSAGRRELVEELYESVYRAGIVSHWEGGYDFARQLVLPPASPDEAHARCVLDLHQYSRGMAYAAIKSAIKEVRGREKTTDLTVITGQGLNRAGKQRTILDVSDLDEEAQRPYRLVDTVQDILIEDFYPPIHSSTAPNNPGRVVIPTGVLTK